MQLNMEPGDAEPDDATPVLPERTDLDSLREAAAGCRGCHLWRPAGPTVFGEGRAEARVMFVGEQPGDCRVSRNELPSTAIALGVGLGFSVGQLGLTVLDLIGLAIAGVMVAALVGRAAKNLRRLAELEPTGRSARVG